MIRIVLLRCILRLFWVFPIKNRRVILNSYNGRLFSCNPKYLALGLKDTGIFEVYFALKDSSDIVDLPQGIISVKYRSLRHFYYLMTSKYIVVNSTGFSGFLPYRKKQVLINTWHGAGAFKVTGVEIFNSKEQVKKRQIFANNTSFFLSSSESYSKRQSKSMLLPPERIIPTGLPRNDIFFRDCPEVVRRVRGYYDIPDSKKIVLYVPTYRDGPVVSMMEYGFPMIDIDKVIEVCSEKWNSEFVFLFKAHHDMIPENLSEMCINASKYPDVQELLYAADIMISDYSSIQWDFALQHKPGFLYIPDLEQYKSVHPLATDYTEWPFEAAFSNDDLVRIIGTYDEGIGKKRIDDYFNRLGSYEAGNAVESILRIAFGEDI